MARDARDMRVMRDEREGRDWRDRQDPTCDIRGSASENLELSPVSLLPPVSHVLRTDIVFPQPDRRGLIGLEVADKTRKTMVTGEFLENSACARLVRRCGGWQSQRSDLRVLPECGFRLLATVRFSLIRLLFL